MWHPFRSPPARTRSSPNSMRSVGSRVWSTPTTTTATTPTSSSSSSKIQNNSPSYVRKWPKVSSPLTTSCSSSKTNSSSFLVKSPSKTASPMLTATTNSSTQKQSPPFLRKRASPPSSFGRPPSMVVVSAVPCASDDLGSLQQRLSSTSSTSSSSGTTFSSTGTAVSSSETMLSSSSSETTLSSSSETTLSSPSAKSASPSSSTSSTITSSSASSASSLSTSRTDFSGAKRIQEWLKERNRAMPLPINLDEPQYDIRQEKQRLFQRLLESDPLWLPQVTFELLKKVPSGGFSNKEVKSLVHLVMRHQAKVAKSAGVTEALLMRLIKEEDDDHNNFRVTGVLWAFAMDAWARQYHSKAPGKRAEALLRLMQERYLEDKCHRTQPGVYNVTMVLQAWANSRVSYAPERAEGILRWMQTDLDIKPNVYSYTSVIHAYAQQGKAEDAERLLQTMENRMETHNSDKMARPNVKTFTAVIRAWSNANEGVDGAHRAEKVLERLVNWYKKLGYTDLRPNRVCFSALMQAWLKSGAPEASSKILGLYDRIKEFEESLSEEERNNRDNRWTLSSCNSLMETLSKAGHPQVVQEILESMLQRVLDGHYYAVAPNDASWATAAYAWALQGDGERAEALLHKLNEFYQAGHVQSKPRLLFYNMVLLAWSKSSEKGAAARAQRILDWLEEQDPHGEEGIQPNTESYNAVLAAWRRSDEAIATQTALHLLHRMEEHYKAGRIQVKPNHLSFFIVMETLAAVRKPKAHLDTLNFLNRVESLHESGIYDDLMSKEYYPLALASCAWTPERDGAVLANEVLRKMEESQNPRFQPDSSSYDNAIAAWARSPRDDALSQAYGLLQKMESKSERHCQPTKFSYNYVLAASFASEEDEALEIAKEMLSRMKDLFENGKSSMTPHPAAFARLFTERIGKELELSSKTAEDMIDWLEETGGNAEFLQACYTYAIQICAWSLDSDANERAQRLWERIRRGSSVVVPTLECFKLVLKAHDGCEGGPEMTERLIETMEKEHSQGIIDWRPDTDCYNSVVRLWSQSLQDDAPQRAFSLLERMDALFQEHGLEGGVVPSFVTYNNVLWACAVTPAKESDTKLKHFTVAVNAFNNMRESNYGTPNHIIYNRLLMCAMILGADPIERDRMTTHVFRQCCRDGQLDNRILKHFWSAAPKATRIKLLGHHRNEISIADVPIEWSRNVSK